MKKNFFFSAVLAIAAAVACTEKGPVDFPIQGDLTLYGENVAGQEVGVFVTSDGLPQSNLLYTAAEGEGAVALTAKAEKAGFKQGNHMIYAYAPYAEAAAELTAVPAPDYSKQSTVAFDPLADDEILAGLMLSYNSTAQSVLYATTEVTELSSAAITLPFAAVNPLTEVTVGEPGLEGTNANAQEGKKVTKIVVTCDKPIAYTGQTLDLTTGKLVGGTAVNSIEIAADMTVKKMGYVTANGFTFKTCLTEEEVATAKFKIEMVMETGKTYAAEDKTPSYGGIYALTLTEVE
jgi:hypothetical protein